MVEVKEPLLTLDGLDDSNRALALYGYTQAFFKLTERGEAVLAGEADFIATNGIDLWLGGVHLCDKEGLWRWDEQNRQLAHKAA